jgi:hypothetical protein
MGPTAGGAGGAGLSQSPGATIYVHDSQLAGGAGGAGGSGGQCCPQTTWPPAASGASGPPAETGAFSPVPGVCTQLVASTIVRENGTLALTVSGLPGDTVYLGLSSFARWTLDLPFSGVWLFGPTARRFAFGTIPAGGVLNVNLPFGLLPAGVDAQQKFLQLVVRTGSGPFRIGTPSALTILDGAF